MFDLSFSPVRSSADNGDFMPAPPADGNGGNASAGGETLQKSAQNLLAHIPGEASGLYLMAADAFSSPTTGVIIFIAILALTILIVVRWLAGASRAVMLTSIVAFLIWMFILDKGVFHQLFPTLLPNPLGLIIAVFYSTVVTLLANAGKIK